MVQIIHNDLQNQQDHTNALEHYGRKNMLEINNIPLKDNENIQAIILAIATAMKYNNFNYEANVDVASLPTKSTCNTSYYCVIQK